MPKRIAVALLGTLLLAATAFAQTAAEKEKEAKDHYEQGIVQYNLTNYQGAIDHFAKAYELTKAPALLFNIAQAYRLKKDYGTARTFYQNYVREQSAVNPNDPNIKEAENFVQEMDRLARESSAGTTTTPTTTPTPTEPVNPNKNSNKGNGNGSATTTSTPTPPVPTPTEPAPDEPARPGAGMKVTGLAVGGAGIVLLGVGAYFWWKTEDYEKETERMSTGGSCDTACADSRAKTGKRYQTLGWTLGPAGIAAIGTGAVLYYLGSRQSASATEMSFVPLEGGGAFVLGGSF